jgi:hypothetical protein
MRVRGETSRNWRDDARAGGDWYRAQGFGAINRVYLKEKPN